MITLAIDTSTTRGSVTVLADGALLLEEAFTADRTHSTLLFTILARARAAAPQLDQIAVGLGPGSFAGVRIAIAAAIGIELALGAKLVGLPSVAALETEVASYIAVGDARRETFYWTRVEDGVCTEGPELLTAEELAVRLAATPLPVFATEPLAVAPHATIAFPSATRMAQLSASGCGITAAGALEPIYLREPHITLPKRRAKP